MPRIPSPGVWILLGALIALPAGWVLMVGLLLWSTWGPRPETVLAEAQPVCAPIIVALKTFHQKHGRYPERLADLVGAGFLARVPELPPHWGTSSRHGPEYEVNHTLDFYRLTYGYCVEGGIGPGDFYYREFVSDDRRGWGPMSATGIGDLVAERILRVYRKEHDAKSLRVFMLEVIGKVDCDYLYRDRVEKWLGAGAEIVVPQGMPGAGKTGHVYRAKNPAGESYCFVYKDHWLPVLKCTLPASKGKAKARDDGTLVDQNYPVLDKLFQVPEAGGPAFWTIVRECPASPRDRPVPLHR